MERLQNNTTQYVQAGLFLATAYLAGSKRFIQYFPKSSRQGLLLSAACGAGFTVIPKKLIGCDVAHYIERKRGKPLGKPYRNLLDVFESLVIGSALAGVISTLLGKKSPIISDEGMLRFQIINTGVAAGVSTILSLTTNRAHDSRNYFEEYQADWDILSGDEQAHYVKQFCDNDLSAFGFDSLRGDFPVEQFLPLPDFQTLNKSKISWYLEMWMKHLILLSTEQTLDLNNAAFQQKILFRANTIRKK